MKHLVTFLASAVLAFSSFALAQSKSTSSSIDLSNPQVVAAGEKTFAASCSVGYCHGKAGRAGRGPRLRGKPWDKQYLYDVILNGVPSSSMPAWKDRLSEQEIWETVAYILTLSKLTSDSVEPVEPSSPSVATPTPEPKEKTAPQPAPLQASLVGDPEQGKSLFFDSSNDLNCGNCHKVHGVGNDVGPDLSHEQQRPVKDLFRDIILPSAAVAPDRETLVITTKNGERVEGLKMAEDDSQIKVYDVGTLPPVLRTIPKSRIQKQQVEKRSGMPMKYAEIYTLKQLLDIIAYLKAGDTAAHSTVSLEDLF